MPESSPAGKAPRQRKKTVIDREVQYGVASKVALHWAVFFFCNFLCLGIWVVLFELPEGTWSEIFGTSFERFFPVLVISVVLMPIFVLDTLKLTNRFAGPISRLRTELKNAGQGRPVNRLHFRTNDYWLEIAEDFNRLAQKAGLIGPVGEKDGPSSP